MKKLILVILMVLGLVTYSFGASVVLTDVKPLGNNIYVIDVSWVANSTDGSVTDTSTSPGWPWSGDDFRKGCVWKVITDPGSPVPTDLYDITLIDANGVDLMGGQLSNISNASSTQHIPKVSSASIYGCNPTTGAFTHTLTNNSVNSAALPSWQL